jgi:hypothetical protein
MSALELESIASYPRALIYAHAMINGRVAAQLRLNISQTNL